MKQSLALFLYWDYTEFMIKKQQQHNGYLTGRLLLATPIKTGDIFEKSVILICAHDENGAMGIILNKLEGVALNDLLIQMEIPSVDSLKNPRIHSGGPVDNTHGFILHNKEYTEKGTANISKNFNLTATSDVLENISAGGGPEDCLIALGYTGWHDGQLEDEIAQNYWISVPADKHSVFNKAIDTMWYTILDENGISPAHLSTQTGNA